MTLINETLGDEDLRRSTKGLLPKTKLEVIAEGTLGAAASILASFGAVIFETPSGGTTPKVGTGGGAAAAIMAMIPIPGLGHGGLGRPEIPLGLRLMVMPMPTRISRIGMINFKCPLESIFCKVSKTFIFWRQKYTFGRVLKQFSWKHSQNIKALITTLLKLWST